MSNVPYPITAESIYDLKSQVWDLIRDLYEEKIAGLNVGDVFANDGDILSLNLTTQSCLEKISGALSVNVQSTGGLSISSTGLAIHCKAGGGATVSADGLQIDTTVVLPSSIFDANTILKADADNVPEALTIPVDTVVGRLTGGEITALSTSDVRTMMDLQRDVRGYREGLVVTIKDADELYVSGGAIEINGTVYDLKSTLTVPLGSVSGNVLYYIYADAPSSGTALTLTDITVSSTPPTFDDSRGAYYKTGDTTKRLLAKYFQAGNLNTNFYPVVAGDDVCWDGSSFWSNTSPYFSLGYSPAGNAGKAYVRFPGVALSPGDTVSSAVVTFTASYNTVTTNCKVRLFGNDADTSIAPTSIVTGDALELTTAYVDWTSGAWSRLSPYDSPDISTVIQEIIDRAGWAYGNAIGLIFDENGGSKSPKYAYVVDDGVAAYYPKLAVVTSDYVEVTSKVVNPTKLNTFIGFDSGNSLDDNDIISYDSVTGSFIGTNIAEQRIVGRITDGEIAALTGSQCRTLMEIDTDDPVTFGSLKVGSATNYSEICAAGIETYHGATAKRKLTLRPVLVEKSSKAGGTPDQIYRGINVGYSLPIWSGPAPDEELYWRMMIPVRWDGTTDPQFGMCVTLVGDETVGDNFKFSLEWQTTKSSSIMGTTTSVAYTEQQVLTGRNLANNVYFVFFNFDADDATNPLKPGDMLQARIRRVDATNPDIDGEVIIWDWSSMWAVDKTYGNWSVETNDT